MTRAQVDHRKFGLAPMEGVSDLPFRLWMSLASSPEFCSTPFLRVTSTFPKNKIPRAFAPELSELRPYISYKLNPQLMAARVEDFLRVAPEILEHCESIDLNCGCPSPNAVGSSAGSSLLSTPETFYNFVSEITDNLGPNKLSVKMRTGFTSHQEFFPLIDSIKELPLRRLGVHGRTRHQRYDGLNRWQLIHQAAKSLPYPVVGSGDILSYENLEKYADCIEPLESVLIGRGALRNPWIFREIRSKENVTLSAGGLMAAITCLALLYYLAITDENALIEFVKKGDFLSPCHESEEQWMLMVEKLSQACFKEMVDIKDIDIPPFVLGRVKMLWNYLRSSLPQQFFQPKVLRSRSLRSLLEGIESICGENRIPLSHNPNHDWIYTSRKKPPAETDASFS